MGKLSSGLRINRAGDDAAGLAISEKMRGQIRGFEQASRNSQDAISLIQTAEGALNETHSILQRMRELAVQSANDTNVSEDREAIQTEINQIVSEVDRIANTTEFNTRKLLNGSSGTSVANGNILGSVNVTSNTKQETYTVNASAATLAKAATTGTNTGSTASATVKAAGTLTINGVTISVGATDTYQILADRINTSVSGVKADFTGTGSTLKIYTEDIGADAKLSIVASADIIHGVDYSNSTNQNYSGSNASGLTAANFGIGALLV